MDLVQKTLKLWRSSEFEWGKSDCILSLADYLVSAGYQDFAAEYRNTYNTENEANKIIKEFGGLETVINSTNLMENVNSIRGDVVLVQMSQQIAGLCTGQCVAFRTERGVLEIGKQFLKIVKTWEIEQCHQ